MITLTLDSIPQRPIQVDELTIRDIEDGRVLFSSGQWLPVIETEEEIWNCIRGDR